MPVSVAAPDPAPLKSGPCLIAIFGPTGIGKSSVAEAVADQTGAVLLNADAFQVYKGLDIGTNKPENKARYRLMDVVGPGDSFGLGEWVRLARAEVAAAKKDRKSVVVVGGTGLYIRALTENYSAMHAPPNPETRARLRDQWTELGLDHMARQLGRLAPEVAKLTDLNNPVRVLRALERLESSPIAPLGPLPMPTVKFGLLTNRANLDRAIETRAQAMIDKGWTKEIESLLDSGVPIGAPALRAIGYQSLVRALKGDLTLELARQTIVKETQRYARRQETWMRSEPNLTQVQVEPLGSEGESGAASAILAHVTRLFGI